MFVKTPEEWVDGFLAPSSGQDWYALTVESQVAVVPVTDQFFVRGRDARMLFAYLRRLGPRRVLRKVRSRQNEQVRNEAWLSVGVGSTPELHDGQRVLFLASGAEGAEVVSVHRNCVSAPASVPQERMTGWGRSLDPDGLVGLVDLRAHAGWRPTGPHPPEPSSAAWDAIAELVSGAGVQTMPSPPAKGSRLTTGGERPSGSALPGYHCFGFGQYAKTQIIPNLSDALALTCVHEIDPLQIGPVSADSTNRWSTNPYPDPNEQIDNAVVAGYHHTHVPIALDLIEAGTRHIVIEKPVGTSPQQVAELAAAIGQHPETRIHVGFQRRYSPFNEYLRRDLGGPPISMAATGYEVPLPDLHWYRWPIVGNAVVSNGCHWIDHFLFLNDFSPVTEVSAQVLSTQIVLNLGLENGASGTISLRHEGAPRKGVRADYEFWRGDASASIIDDRYVAEHGFRKVRSASVHPYASLEKMYKTFGRRIALDLAGDSLESTKVSSGAILDLAALVDEQLDARSRR